MNNTIRLRIKKDIDALTEKKILKLKGSIIAQSFTDIIHFDDDGEDFYVNYFLVAPGKRDEIIAYIRSYIESAMLPTLIEIV